MENLECFGFILIGHFFQLVIYRLLKEKKKGENFYVDEVMCKDGCHIYSCQIGTSNHYLISFFPAFLSELIIQMC